MSGGLTGTVPEANASPEHSPSDQAGASLSAPGPWTCFVVRQNGQEIPLATRPLAALPQAVHHAGHRLRFGGTETPCAVALGPDGRVYFAADQRGFDVTTPDGRRWRGRAEGAVFRCHRDGRELELLARGLREPRWLAFDETGALWVAEAGFFAVPEGFDGRWQAALESHTAARAAWEAERRAAPDWEAAAPFLQALATSNAELERDVFSAPFPWAAENFSVLTPEAAAARWAIVLNARHPTPERRLALWELAEGTGDTSQRLALSRTALDDPDPAWRAALLALLGDTRGSAAVPAFEAALADPEPSVAAAAALALGKTAGAQAVAPLLARLRQPQVPEPLLLAAAATLATVSEPAVLAPLLHDPAPAVQAAALEALRRLRAPECGAPLLASEGPLTSLHQAATQAVYDAEIEGAWPALAQWLEHAGPSSSPRLIQRALEANLDLGSEADALRVAQFLAEHLTAESPMRDATLSLAAAQILDQWDTPPARESLYGRWRQASPRPPGTVWPAWELALPALEKATGPMRETLLVLATRWRALLTSAPSSVEELSLYLLKPEVPETQRQYFLRKKLAPGARPLPEQTALAEAALQATSSPSLRMTARTFLFANASRNIPWLLGTLQGATVEEKQHALNLIGSRQNRETEAYLQQLLQQARSDGVDFAVLPELLAAAESRRHRNDADTREWQHLLDAFRASRLGPTLDTLRVWRPALEPGDPLAGRALFFSARTRCALCHAVQGRGGAAPLPGPDLDDVAARLDARALLESLVRPNARLAEGYGLTTVITREGAIYTGRLDETSTGLFLHLPGQRLAFERTDVASLGDPVSPCRPVGTLLSLKELRDLMTFLQQLRPASEAK